MTHPLDQWLAKLGHGRGRWVGSDEVRVYCPIHEAGGVGKPSLTVTWQNGKPLVTCWSERCGASQEDLWRACSDYGLPGTDRQERHQQSRVNDSKPKTAKRSEKPAATAPEKPEPPKESHHELGRWTNSWEYTDADGRTIMWVCRFPTPDGPRPKEFRPWAYKDGRWGWGDPPGKLPLYGLAEIAAHPEKPVLVVEGEKTADHARDLLPGYAVVTWPHGAKATQKADWTPLAGRDVTFWPDADQDGQEAAEKGAVETHQAGAAVSRIVTLPSGLAIGWDLADPLPDRWDEDRVTDLIRGARVAHQNEKPKASRFELVPFREITLSLEPAYVVKGLVPRDDLTIVWGKPKCGKSFWVYDLAMCVAMGWNYRGHRVLQGPVVYVACEGAHGLRARVEAYRQHHDIASNDDVPFYLLPTRIDLVEDAEALIEEIQQTLGGVRPVLIVVDTLNRSMPGSESSDEDMSNYVKASDKVREAFECAVLVVHHCGIDGTRPRGHTALIGAAGAQIAIKKDETGLITATLEFMKDGPEGEEVQCRLTVTKVGTDTDGDAITSCVVTPADGEKPAKRRRKVSGQTAIALQFLRKAIGEAGQEPPPSSHIPGGQNRVVPLPLWRRYCQQGGLAGGDSDDSFKKAWKRVRHTLQQEPAIIGIWDEWVWLATDEGDRGTKGGQEGDMSPEA